MTYEIVTNATDPNNVFISIFSEVSSLGTGLLIFIWGVIALLGYFSENRRTGSQSILTWISIGGLITTFFSFIFYILDWIVIETVIITCAVWICSVIVWFLFDAEVFSDRLN